MARYLSIGPTFQRGPKMTREYWRAVARALGFYLIYAIVIFVIVFPWPHYGTVYQHYWKFIDRQMMVFLPLVLGLSWFLSITMAIVLPYPEIRRWEGEKVKPTKQRGKVSQFLHDCFKFHTKKPNHAADQTMAPPVTITIADTEAHSSDDQEAVPGAPVAPVPAPAPAYQAPSDIDEMEAIDPKECAVIIPTHNSAGVVRETIQAAARYVPYKNIYIIDNGVRRGEPNILTEKVVKGISQDINYYFFPIPSKAVNLYLGSVVAKEFNYIFLLDDDTIFPEGFCWPSKPKNRRTSYGFNICGVNRERKREGFVVKLQDWEYKVAGYRKYVQGATSSTVFHHGAIGFWEREAYQATWKKHYALPLGDDRLSGMENLFLGNKMGYIASGTPFQTIVPEQLLWAKKGTFWTVFKQRSFRWNVANFRHLWLDVWLFLTYIPRQSNIIKTILSAIVFRVFLVLELSSMYITINMPIALIFLLHYHWRWWLIIHACLYGSAVLQGLFSNYVIMRKRPDLRVEWHILFAAPIYRFVLRWFRLVGIVVSALVYVPLYPLPTKLDRRPEVQAVLKRLEISGMKIQPELPQEFLSMDKYTECEMRMQRDEEDIENETAAHDPPVDRASAATASASARDSAGFDDTAERFEAFQIPEKQLDDAMNLVESFSLQEVLAKEPPTLSEFAKERDSGNNETGDHPLEVVVVGNDSDHEESDSSNEEA